MFRKVPLIVILGSTGTGKTKLSLELAERFGGEIISADSMQVYANLNIVTAKATAEEQSRAKHHLLDVATPAEPYTVVNFRNAALPIIENLLAQSKWPIVVGGTNYYIESLLWDTLVSATLTSTGPDKTASQAAAMAATTTTPATTPSTPATGETAAATLSGNVKNPPLLTDDEMSTMPSELLHNHLRTIDPVTANRMHPNNKRKIMRAIEVYQQTGQTLSSKLQEQRQQEGGNRLGGPLRYPHTILLWLRCRQDVLNARLERRVDGMLEQGLLHEIRAFHNVHKCDESADNSYTKGILQTIGFKEFIPYLEQFDAANDRLIEEYLRLNAYQMPTEEYFEAYNKAARKALKANAAAITPGQVASPVESPAPLPPGLELLNACLNELKLVTRRYSKRQIKWINNRFLASRDRQVPDLYELDTTDVSQWQEAVYQRAMTIIDCYRSAAVSEVPPLPHVVHPGEGLDEEVSNFCEACQRHFVGEFQWQLHLNSNKHRRQRHKQKKVQGTQAAGDTVADILAH